MKFQWYTIHFRARVRLKGVKLYASDYYSTCVSHRRNISRFDFSYYIDVPLTLILLYSYPALVAGVSWTVYILILNKLDLMFIDGGFFWVSSVALWVGYFDTNDFKSTLSLLLCEEKSWNRLSWWSTWFFGIQMICYDTVGLLRL